ncbi:hypothetical protein EGT50_15160 [Rhodococcus xishaensis]|uniref:Uncharacterized protein n=1 Tax=Rhodococcus xishaensis TaxID=2487364 RepID=A0A3S3AHJ0_9NOCA|nr:hypothetical protein EGT50_15160 [Rhodococcus xishaensis]
MGRDTTHSEAVIGATPTNSPNVIELAESALQRPRPHCEADGPTDRIRQARPLGACGIGHSDATAVTRHTAAQPTINRIGPAHGS